MKRIVVIGGTGHFGARICRRLAGYKDSELVVTSRTLAHAQAAVDKLRTEESAVLVSAAGLDQSSPGFAADLRDLAPDIVVHTAGPYQGQGYSVAKACVEARSHYIDLADGREFVLGFHRLHEEAVQQGVALICGASTLPGLSSAVVDSLRGRFQAIDTIGISIAPAHQTPRGRSTIAAVLSYCGRPFRVLTDNNWQTQYGWQDLQWQTYPALGRRLSAACDVPDLALLPEYVSGVRTITFHAALEAKREQLSLWLMAWLTRVGIVRSWDKLVPVFQWLSDRLIGFGSDTGGMQITLTGKDIGGRALAARWDLVARQNHGPEIPCIPACILVRKLVAGTMTARGAFPCLGMISMQDFAQEVADLDIEWVVTESKSR